MRWIRRLRYWMKLREEARELREELEFHRSMAEEAGRHRGLSPAEARSAARRTLGNALLASEEARRVWVVAWLESVAQDLRYALRVLLKEPGFTALALLAMLLGIGLNTSLFTVVNALLTDSWSVPQADRVVKLLAVDPRSGLRGGGGLALTAVRYLNERSQTISGVFAWRSYQATLEERGQPVRVDFVSGNFFQVLEVGALLGRTFGTDEDVPGSPLPVAVLSYRTWRQEYGADPDILDRTAHLDGVPFEVIGVSERSFAGTSENQADFWVPFATWPLVRAYDPGAATLLTDPNRCCSEAAARLLPGIPRQQAAAELGTLYRQYLLDMNRKPASILLTGTALLDHPEWLRRMAPVLAVLFLVSLSILLLACANVANLQLARGAAREREIAVRLALGAGRGRVIRQLLTEGLLPALLAGGGGLLLAALLPKAVLSCLGQTPPTNLDLLPDANVAAFAVAIAFVAAFAFGLVPALRATRTSLNGVLKRWSTQASPRFRLRGALLGVQVAISVALLMAAGLLVRGLEWARSLDLGFRTSDVSAIQVTLPANAYDPSGEKAFFDDFFARFQGGSRIAALSLLMPLGDRYEYTDFRAECDSQFPVLTQRVTGAYFKLLEIPILAGRSFLPENQERGSILVNQALARRCWGERSPLGLSAVIGGRPRRIVGVVRDAQVYGIGSVPPTYFGPFVPDGHFVRGGGVFLVPTSLTESALEVLRDQDARAHLEVVPLERQVDRFLGTTQGIARLAGGLGALALLLATLGVHGVISYSVQKRRREIGVRLALGARGRQVVGLILGRTAVPLLVGLLTGLAFTVGETVVLRSRLYGLSPLDPAACGGVLAILLLAGLAATVVPTRRALQTDTVEVLRHE